MTDPLVQIYSKDCQSQTRWVRKLKFWENVHNTLCVMCDVSRVTCHVSCVTCHMSPVTCKKKYIFLNWTKWWRFLPSSWQDKNFVWSHLNATYGSFKNSIYLHSWKPYKNASNMWDGFLIILISLMTFKLVSFWHLYLTSPLLLSLSLSTKWFHYSNLLYSSSLKAWVYRSKMVSVQSEGEHLSNMCRFIHVYFILISTSKPRSCTIFFSFICHQWWP